MATKKTAKSPPARLKPGELEMLGRVTRGVPFVLSPVLYPVSQEEITAREVLQTICTYGGSMTIAAIKQVFGPERTRNLFGSSAPEVLLQRFPNILYLEVKRFDKTLVTARTDVKLCQNYANNGCHKTYPGVHCGDLHLCRFFLLDTCKFGSNKCKYSHQLQRDPHNHAVLQNNMLDYLEEGSLKKLLCQNCSPSNSAGQYPGICSFYNKGNDRCSKGDTCPFLHVCRHYLIGDCTFGEKECKRSHNICDPQPRTLLEKSGVDFKRMPPKRLVRLLSEQLKDLQLDPSASSSPPKKNAATASTRTRTTSGSGANYVLDTDTEICTYHIRGKCNFGRVCKGHHCSLPYLWQYQDFLTGAWTDFGDKENVEIETAYCDVSNDAKNVQTVNGMGKIDFRSMKLSIPNTVAGTAVNVRRLSTKSSVSLPDSHPFGTVWLWYWKDEYDIWHKYGDKNSQQMQANKDSADIEEKYQEYRDTRGSSSVGFKTDEHSYDLDLAKMCQTNRSYHTHTERPVQRRPKLVTEQDVKNYAALRKLKRTKASSSSSSPTAGKTPAGVAYPDTWDIYSSASDDTADYQLTEVPVAGTTYQEHKEVLTLLEKTLSNVSVVSIKRVQNAELWDNYYRRRETMVKKNGGKPVDEKQLFHGTKKEILEAICQQNFDWRVSNSGCAYGQGSYFARDASYSDNYAKSNPNGNQFMFLALVLVGSYVDGYSSIKKPPPKDPSKPFENFYDSCVNSSSSGDPSIFVIFDSRQVYPQYLIEYKR